MNVERRLARLEVIELFNHHSNGVFRLELLIPRIATQRVVAAKLVSDAAHLEGFAGRLLEADVQQIDEALVLHSLSGFVPLQVFGAQVGLTEMNFYADLTVARNVLRNTVEENLVYSFLDLEVVFKANDVRAAVSVAEVLHKIVNLG